MPARDCRGGLLLQADDPRGNEHQSRAGQLNQRDRFAEKIPPPALSAMP